MYLITSADSPSKTKQNIQLKLQQCKYSKEEHMLKIT